MKLWDQLRTMVKKEVGAKDAISSPPPFVAKSGMVTEAAKKLKIPIHSLQPASQVTSSDLMGIPVISTNTGASVARTPKTKTRIQFRDEAILPELIEEAMLGIAYALYTAPDRMIGAPSDTIIFVPKAPLDLLARTSGCSYVYNYKDKRYFAFARKSASGAYAYRVHEAENDAQIAEPSVANISTPLWTEPYWDQTEIIRKITGTDTVVIPPAVDPVHLYTQHCREIEAMLNGRQLPPTVVQTTIDPQFYLANIAPVSQAEIS